MKKEKKHFHISKSSDDINKVSNQTKSFIINNSHNSQKTFNIFEEKNFNQGIFKSNFLEEMYLKYSKNLQKYFIKNQTGLKLAGNKYFKNLTVEDYMKQNNLTQEEFISLLNGIYHNEITKDNFFLTPMPNKSRQLLETNKEKNDFLEAERSAVVMRTFEYTRGIKSRVGMRELKKVMEEQKKRLINLMLASASKIQRWWKKKFVIINQNKNNETYQKKIFYYNYMLNKKKAKIFFDKINNIFKKKKKIKFELFTKKLNLKAKKSKKKFFTIFDWVNNMKICPQNKFNILKQNISHLIKKNFGFKNNFFMTKISFGNSQNNLNNNNNSFIYQIKKIIFLQKMFRHYLRIKKGKQNLKKFINNNNSQFAYFSPNKMIFLYNKNISSEAKEIKSLSKNSNNLYYNQNTKKKANLPNLSPISKNINENDDYLENDNNINNDETYKINKDIITLKNIKEKKNTIERNNSLQYKEYKSDTNFRIEVRKMSNLSDISNKKNIPNKKIFKSFQDIKRNDNNKKQSKLLFNSKKSNKSTSSNKTKKLSTNKLIYNNMVNYDSDNNNIRNKNRYKAKIEKNNLLKNNLLKIEENELSLITSTNNNINNNTSQYNNNLILIDSLEIEKDKKGEKKITNPNNSNNNEENEYLEKSFPPELNMDNYQQDSTIDFRDKRIKSNQKTISSSAIYHLDTSDNHILINNQIYHETPYPYQILGQIYLNYIHRPLVMNKNYYIEKIKKNIFASDLKHSLINILNIKNNNFSFAKQISLNKSSILKKYLKQWKYVTNKTSKPYIYNKTITSISNSSDNSEKNNFSYYCRINKSNCENDFIFLRISLGYKLIKKILSVKDIKKFLYLLKRRQRRNVSNKIYNNNNNNFSNYSKNDFHLLEFKTKLPVILNKVLIKKYFAIFFHKFLFFAMNLDKNKFFDINNKNCKLIIEGYRKGYFSIMYHIFQIKLNFQYFNTGLQLGNFIQDLLKLK